MKRSGRFLARHLWLVALGAIVAGALIFSGPALAGPEGTQKWAFATGGGVVFFAGHWRRRHHLRGVI